MSNSVQIEFVKGEVAPKYSEGSEIVCDKVVITEQGTQGKLPIVDFVMSGPGGEKYLLVLTGRIVNMIAHAVAGVNQRNHGVREP